MRRDRGAPRLASGSRPERRRAPGRIGPAALIAAVVIVVGGSALLATGTDPAAPVTNATSVAATAPPVTVSPSGPEGPTGVSDRPTGSAGHGRSGPGGPHSDPLTSGPDPAVALTSPVHITPAPDGTPLAAAAGTEPGSMSPVDLAAGWVSSVHRFTSSGMVRSYLLVRPSAPGAGPLPVLVVLHGRYLTPALMERIAGLWRAAGPSIQVYPAGYGRSWNAGGCCGEAYETHVNDLAFLTSVVHSVLATNHDADPGRVYAAGFSNGGRMAYRLACDEPGLFAGIVAVEGVPVDQCQSTKPLPVLIVANRYDPLLTIDLGQRPKSIYNSLEPTVEGEVERWRTLDGCNPGELAGVEGRLHVTTYDHCRGTGRVTFAEYEYGGHDWSTGGPGTPSAAELTWSFLAGRDVGELTSVVSPS